MTVSCKEYLELKKAFLAKHNYEYHVETSQMDQYGRYYKHYICDDGAIWYETMSPEWEQVEAEVKLVKCKFDVKMLRTEFFSSDDAKSRFYYEKF